MPDAVLVVDMLRGFLEEGHNLYCGEGARSIIPNVRSLIEQEQARGSQVFFICDTHDPDDLEFQTFPIHCVRGTEEAEVIPELAGYSGETIPEAALQRVLRHRSGATACLPAPRQGSGVRGMHRHLRDVHDLGRSKPGLPG